jgi:DNA invertase Pin-like site-specific DNA recombinase
MATVLIYSPDRLSRKYTYQVLLSEELTRCGVDIVFLKSPAGGSPEDQLVVQFQGMIAEYERAQIAERSRRGKRHKAQQGVVNVLCGAPYGYRYMKKTDTSAAYYEVLESQAGVVRMVFEMYTKQQLNIREIARLLNQRGIPTKTGKTRWERSTVWGLLRNPAYQGKACYGKTEQRPRQRITRALRQRNGIPKRSNSSGHERPRSEWITVPVPAAENLSAFRKKLHARAKTLDVRERQQILRLPVKEILVDTQSLTIRHSIPISQSQKSPATSGSPTTQTPPSAAPQPSSYLLRPRSHRPALRRSFFRSRNDSSHHKPRVQPFANQAQDERVCNPKSNHLLQPFMLDVVKVASDVGLE